MLRRSLLVSATTVLVLSAATQVLAETVDSPPFPYAAPEEVGLSSEKLDLIGDSVATWVVMATSSEPSF